jgi:hypothetical protein
LELFRSVAVVNKIMLVNRDRDEGKQLLERLQKRNARFLTTGQNEGVDQYIFDRGFRAFMEAGGLHQFLED